jgi:hypothetical protein
MPVAGHLLQAVRVFALWLRIGRSCLAITTTALCGQRSRRAGEPATAVANVGVAPFAHSCAVFVCTGKPQTLAGLPGHAAGGHQYVAAHYEGHPDEAASYYLVLNGSSGVGGDG